MGRIEGEASETIEAPIARVFEVAADVEGSPRWQPQIKRAECIDRDGEGRQVLVDTVTDGKVRDLRSRLRFAYDEPTSIRGIRRTATCPTSPAAGRSRTRVMGRVRATYALSVDLGRMLGLVVRGPVVDLLRKQMVDTMPGKLKSFVENGEG